MLFTRWGRVGVVGQFSEIPYKNLAAAMKEYNKKLHEKSKTYRLVEMNYEDNTEEKKIEQPKKKDQPNSSLPPPVQNLI